MERKRKPPPPLSLRRGKHFEMASQVHEAALLYLKGEAVLVIAQEQDHCEDFLDAVFAEIERIEKDASDLSVDDPSHGSDPRSPSNKRVC